MFRGSRRGGRWRGRRGGSRRGRLTLEGRNLLEDLGVEDVVRQTVAGEDDEVVRLDLDGVVLRVVLRGISRVRAELEGLVELWTMKR